jgi:hypothetical protein
MAMDKVYQDLPLNTDRHELRLVTILTNQSSRLLECSMGVFSLIDTSPAYNTFLAREDFSHASPSDILRTWLTKSQTRNSDSERLPVVATPGEKRFQWGDYAALSYCWGDITSTATILVNNVETQVTRSLMEALQNLQEAVGFTGDFRLWVDALCINQNDTDERSHQVASMARFYSCAWSVLAFTGMEENASGDALDLARTLAGHCDLHTQCEELRDNMMQHKFQHKSGAWLALHQVFQRPYWGRLWVTQELVLGGLRATIFCGTSDISWAEFCSGIGVIHRYLWTARHEALRRDFSTLALDYDMNSNDFAIAVAQSHRIWKDLWHMTQALESRSRLPGFGRLLEVANACSCRETRDKVYGLLGIMDVKLSRAISPDYDADAAFVFQTVAKSYISTYDSLELLREANMSGVAGAPSWVPDWSWRGRSRDGRSDDAPDARTPTEKIPYHADNRLSFSLPVFDGARLICQAKLLDTVDGLGCNPETNGQVCQCVSQSIPYGREGITAEDIAVTLYASRKWTPGKSTALLHLPKTTEDARRQFTALGWDLFLQEMVHYDRWVAWLQSNASLIISGRSFGEYFSGKIQDNADVEEYLSAFQAWVRTCLAGTRRLVVTTASRLGWVPARNTTRGAVVEVTNGDILAIFLRCSTPIVLRPTEKDNTFHVLGEAYIHGIMEGELLDLPEYRGCIVRTISLE